MAMFAGVVERNRAIEMGSSFRDLSGVDERQPHLLMRDHAWSGRGLLFREGRKLSREFARHVAIESEKVRDP